MPHSRLLLDVWREASRHVEIGEVVERVAALLPETFPAAALLVRRLDAERGRLETVAVGLRGATPPHPATRTELSPQRLREVLAWYRAGDITRGAADAAEGPLAWLVPARTRGDAVAGPLMGPRGEPLGVLLSIAPPHALGDGDAEVVAQLLEPVAVALLNDARLHELTRLRQSLEADKSALLTRLGRQEIADAVVGEEAGLRSVMERVAQVAPADVPVLLLGETGTGKEVIARELHRRSPRAAGPVVRVNCGAIPAGLIDSELFGHERGAFTGAVGEREGWFERADGGTLFLDEIGELPLEAQVRLLRVIQDGTFERVGGRRTHAVDVRIVAATHRDLLSMVQAGRFREDLWYRLSVFPIRLPPLRERTDDIPALAAHFAARAGRRLGGFPLVPSDADVELLVRYPWPGNVRELAAVVERAAILGGGQRLELAAALGVSPPPPPQTEAYALPAPAPSPGIAPLDAATAQHIERALAASHGRVEGPFGAAAMLGVNPHTLRARMRKLGINWARFRPTSTK
ncbi:MAG TPA: sigma 54-interacting transcriptional regulator [Longimicrobium sp.]|nr:sigma 54-interacting transcriptional regulator [Longimicrobium sp.]